MTPDQVDQLNKLQKQLYELQRLIELHTHTGMDGSTKLATSGGGGGGTVEVKDGATTVAAASIIDFTQNATVTDLGSGHATVAIVPSGSDTNIQFNNAGVFGVDPDFNWRTGAVASTGGDSVIEFGAFNYSPFYVGMVQSEPAIALPQGTQKFIIGPFNTVAGGSDYDGGDIRIFALDSGAASNNQGGQVWLQGGSSTFFGSTGGQIYVGQATGNAAGGQVQIVGGDSGSFDGNGGDVVLVGGEKNGVGHHGKIFFAGGTGGRSYKAAGILTTNTNGYHAVEDVVSLTNVGPSGYVRARVIGRNHANDDILAAELVQAFKTSAGPTLALVGSLTFVFFYGDAAVADVKFAVNGTDTIELQVQPDTGTTYEWQYELEYIAD
jgi:hypothetical protein